MTDSFDPTKLGFSPVAPQNPQQQSTFNPSSLGFSPAGKVAPQDNSQGQQATQTVPESSAATIPAAIVGGLSNAGANIGQTVLDAGTWTLNKLGVIAPTTKKQMDRFIEAGTKPFKVQANPNGDVFERAMAEHPYIGGAAEYSAEIPAIASATLPKLVSTPEGAGMLAKAVGFGTNGLGQAATNMALAAGASGTQPGEQDTAAKMAALMTPVGGLIGSGLNKMAAKAQVPQKLKDLMQSVNSDLYANNQMSLTDKAATSTTNYATAAKQHSNELWDSIKSIPGNVNMQDPKNQLKLLMQQSGSKLTTQGWDNTASRLSDVQQNAISNIADTVLNVQSMDDALKFKQLLSQNYSKFSGGQATDTVYSLYKNIQNSVNNTIKQKAIDNGLLDNYNAANLFHQQTIVPLQNMKAFDIANATANKTADVGTYNQLTKSWLSSAFQNPNAMKAALSVMDGQGSKIMEQAFINNTFKDIIDSPNAVNLNTSLLKLNQFKSKFGAVLSSDSNSVLAGIKKILEEGGAVAGPKASNAAVALGERIAGMRIGGGLAGGALGAIGGPVGSTLGAIAGSAIGPAVMTKLYNGVGALLDTPYGIKMLQGVGEGKPWSKAIINTLGIGFPAKMTNAMYGKDEDRQ